MLNRHTVSKIVWVNAQNPTSDEVRGLLNEFELKPHIAQELLAPTRRPKIDLHTDQAYVILHFPADEKQNSLEVDFVITDQVLITAHYGPVPALERFASRLEVSEAADDANMHETPSALFFDLLHTLYNSTEENIDDIETSLEDIEDRVFSGNERAMVERLSHVGRRIVDVKQVIEHQTDVLKVLTTKGHTFFHESFARNLSRIAEKHAHIRRRIAISQEFLQEIRTTNDSLLSTKQNSVMLVLTIMAVSMLPATFVASIFGVNVQTPFLNHPHGFWIIIGIILGLTIITFLFFRNKEWL